MPSKKPTEKQALQNVPDLRKQKEKTFSPMKAQVAFFLENGLLSQSGDKATALDQLINDLAENTSILQEMGAHKPNVKRDKKLIQALKNIKTQANNLIKRNTAKVDGLDDWRINLMQAFEVGASLPSNSDIIKTFKDTPAHHVKELVDLFSKARPLLRSEVSEDTLKAAPDCMFSEETPKQCAYAGNALIHGVAPEHRYVDEDKANWQRRVAINMGCEPGFSKL